MTELVDSVYYGCSNDNPRGSSNPYVKHTTHHYQDETTIHFGGDMAGVSNPIITSFSTWPVCRLTSSSAMAARPREA